MDKVKSILVYAFLTQMITGILIAGLFYFWSDWLALHYFKTESASHILKVFSLYFIGYNFFQVLSTFFLDTQKVFQTKIIEFIRIAGIAITTAFLFFTKTGTLENYSIAWVSGLYIGIITALFIFLKYFYREHFQWEKILRNTALFKEISKYALMVFLGASAGTILSQIDLQMVIYLLWAKSAGYYTNYLSIISISSIIIWPIILLLFPLFSELHAKKDTTKILLLKEMLVNNFIILSIAFSVFFFVFAEPIALVLFGEKFILSWNILQYSILFLVFQFLLSINFSILAGIGKVKERAKIVFIAVIFNFTTNYFFIQWLWIYGAALATWIGWILMRILWERFLWKWYCSKIDWKNIFINFFAFSFIWIFLFYYVFPLFAWDNRWISLGYLFVIFFIYLCFFIGVNYGKMKWLVLEVKRIKWKK